MPESDNKFFREALADFTAGFAYADAVRHLHQIGMSPEEIQGRLSYPVSLEIIEDVIKKYEERINSPEADYEIVEEVSELGRRSFVRKKINK